MKFNWMTFHKFMAALLLIWVIFGCGGGGGGTTQTAELTGRILWIETGAGPNPAASVQANSNSTATDLSDGFFLLNATIGTTAIQVAHTPTGGSPVTAQFNFSGLTANTDLGDLYIGPNTVTIAGRVVDSTNGNAVAGSLVKIAGRSGSSDASGNFSIPNVAYSAANTAVFFGLQGTVSRTTYFTGFFSPPSGPVGGVVDVGTVSLTPEGGSNPPPLPYNLKGRVLPAGQGANSTVELLSGLTVIRTTSADSLGDFTLWAPTGTYTLRATLGARQGSTSVTITQPDQVVTANVTLSP